MSRTVYVNGHYHPYAEAMIHAEDRGFQFGDAVYEVCPIVGGRMVDATRHLARLTRSLTELRMEAPMTTPALQNVMRETVRRNRVHNGFVYLQVSRGAGRRDFVFPPPGTRRTVVCIARSLPLQAGEEQARRGVAVKSIPDIRWGRPDIKTVQLLAAALAKEEARAAGAKEAWLVDHDGKVTEGASSNAWIVTTGNKLVTRQADRGILRGITRTVLVDAVTKEGLALEERAFTIAEAQAAREAFITSATNFVMPVVSVDGKPVGTGKPGEFTLQLRMLFLRSAEYS